MWILLVVSFNSVNLTSFIATQEFNTRETCQAAGARIWEFSKQEAKWSCLPK